MKVTVRISGHLANSKRVRACIRLLTTTGIANTAIEWYLSNGNVRPELPEYQRVTAMGLALGYVAEAAHQFHRLERRLSPKAKWEPKTVSAWAFLHETSTLSVVQDLLTIRNQGVFHTDDLPVFDFLLGAARRGEEIHLIDDLGPGTRSYPRISIDVLYAWLVRNNVQDESRARTFLRILRSIDLICYETLKGLVPIKVVDDEETPTA